MPTTDLLKQPDPVEQGTDSNSTALYDTIDAMYM